LLLQVWRFDKMGHDLLPPHLEVMGLGKKLGLRLRD
jgi:hypothetical protein